MKNLKQNPMKGNQKPLSPLTKPGSISKNRKQTKQIDNSKKHRNQLDYNRVTIRDRINILHDYTIHKVSLPLIRDKYNIKYNTLLHIISQYRATGRVDSQKYRRKVAKLQEEDLD